MSADAKVWEEDGEWRGVHDGPCVVGGEHAGSLGEVVADVEVCLGGGSLRWTIRTYPEGEVGLVGWVV